MNRAEDIPTVRFAELHDGTLVPVSSVQTALLILGPMYDQETAMVAAAFALAWDEYAPISDAARSYLENQGILQDGVMHASVRSVLKNALGMVNPVVEVHEGDTNDD